MYKSGLLAIVVVVVISRCKPQTDLSKNYRNSKDLAFELIKLCVDTMRGANTAINTNNYILDLSSIDTINKVGVDSFLALRNSISPKAHDDSLVVFDEYDPSKFKMKQSMLIKFHTIGASSANKTLVRASKIKSFDELVHASIELERTPEGYGITGFRITD